MATIFRPILASAWLLTSLMHSAHAGPAAPQAFKLCGWVNNPTPAEVSLIQRSTTWHISQPGQHQANGDWTGVRGAEWVGETNGLGHGCGCVRAVADAGERRVIHILSAKPQPRAWCTKATKLRDLEPKLR